MEKTLHYITSTNYAEFTAIMALACFVGFMLAVFVWEILGAIDRATTLIIKIMYVPLSWMAYKTAQLLILAFVTAVVTIVINPTVLSYIF
jgi:hypothetical protein